MHVDAGDDGMCKELKRFCQDNSFACGMHSCTLKVYTPSELLMPDSAPGDFNRSSKVAAQK